MPVYICAGLSILILTSPRPLVHAEFLGRLRTSDLDILRQTANRVVQERERMILQLQEIARECMKDEAREEAAATAIRLLGRLRAEEAIPFLVNNINFEPQDRSRSNARHRRGRPAIPALIAIGSPVLKWVTDKLEDSSDEREQEAAISVIHSVLGTELAIDHLKRRITRTKDAKILARLTRANKQLESRPRIEPARGTKFEPGPGPPPIYPP